MGFLGPVAGLPALVGLLWVSPLGLGGAMPGLGEEPFPSCPGAILFLGCDGADCPGPPCSEAGETGASNPPWVGNVDCCQGGGVCMKAKWRFTIGQRCDAFQGSDCGWLWSCEITGGTTQSHPDSFYRYHVNCFTCPDLECQANITETESNPNAGTITCYD